jgi:hypothetical protein
VTYAKRTRRAVDVTTKYVPAFGFGIGLPYGLDMAVVCGVVLTGFSMIPVWVYVDYAEGRVENIADCRDDDKLNDHF